MKIAYDTTLPDQRTQVIAKRGWDVIEARLMIRLHLRVTEEP